MENSAYSCVILWQTKDYLVQKKCQKPSKDIFSHYKQFINIVLYHENYENKKMYYEQHQNIFVNNFFLTKPIFTNKNGVHFKIKSLMKKTGWDHYQDFCKLFIKQQ
jgi:hypothetical protein